jgi:hypothetical protein
LTYGSHPQLGYVPAWSQGFNLFGLDSKTNFLQRLKRKNPSRMPYHRKVPQISPSPSGNFYLHHSSHHELAGYSHSSIPLEGPLFGLMLRIHFLLQRINPRRRTSNHPFQKAATQLRTFRYRHRSKNA